MWCSIRFAVAGPPSTPPSNSVAKGRLRDTYGPDVAIKTVGEPVTYQDAVALASKDGDNDKYQFQWWAECQRALLTVALDALDRTPTERAELRRLFPQHLLENRTSPTGATLPPVNPT